MKKLLLVFVALAVISGCVVRDEVHKTTQTIGEVSDEIVQPRQGKGPMGTNYEVSPASTGEDGQLKINF